MINLDDIAHLQTEIAGYDPVDLLMIVASALAAGEPAPPIAADWFAKAVDQWLIKSISLDQALALKPAAGERRAGTRHRLEARDMALRSAARLAGRQGSALADATLLQRSLSRYLTGPWRRTGQALSCPHEADTIDAALWHVARLNGGCPLGVERIRRVLGASYHYSLPKNAEKQAGQSLKPRSGGR